MSTEKETPPYKDITEEMSALEYLEFADNLFHSVFAFFEQIAEETPALAISIDVMKFPFYLDILQSIRDDEEEFCHHSVLDAYLVVLRRVGNQLLQDE